MTRERSRPGDPRPRPPRPACHSWRPPCDSGHPRRSRQRLHFGRAGPASPARRNPHTKRVHPWQSARVRWRADQPKRRPGEAKTGGPRFASASCCAPSMNTTARACTSASCWTPCWSWTARNQYVLFYAQRRAAGPVSPTSQRARSGRARAREAALGPGRRAAGRPAGAASTSCSTTSSASPSSRRAPPSCSSGAPSTGRSPSTTRRWATGSTGVYNILSIPLFCRRAARVLTNSDSLARELEQLAGVSRGQDGHDLRRGRRALHPYHRSHRARPGARAVRAARSSRSS